MSIRLGGPVFGRFSDPDAWAQAHHALGYRAAYCPVGVDATDAEIDAYASAAARHDLVISEVGAWSNPLSPDPQTADAALAKCVRALTLADKLGASCAVNIVGSCGAVWDGPDAQNLTDATFDKIVAVTRQIIDTAQPTRAFWTIEAMPWMYPTGPDEYRALLDAIDHPMLGVHLDPVNMVNSVPRYFGNAALIQECFATLGPWIKNCHAKDILLRPSLTVHLDEVIPGRGALDYGVFLQELDRLGNDRVALMLEHLSSPDDYIEAAAHVRTVAARVGVSVESPLR